MEQPEATGKAPRAIWVGVALAGCVGLTLVAAIFFRTRVMSEGERWRKQVIGGSSGTVTTKIVEGIALHPGRRRDEILAVDRPEFGNEPAGAAPLSDEDRVVGVEWEGEARAYPMWILGSREIVNDRIATEPVCVTYCPYSDSAAVFRGKAGGWELRFGNEGALYECNLVMYDRETGSLWYQLRGISMEGRLKGAELERIPCVVATWGEWRRRNPGTRVLIGEEGTGRFFRVGGVSESGAPHGDGPAAPVSRMDPRLKPKEKVIGFKGPGVDLCVTEAWLRSLGAGADGIALRDGDEVRVERSGLGYWVQQRGGERVSGVGAYWFAWHAAFPGGTLLTNGHGGRGLTKGQTQ